MFTDGMILYIENPKQFTKKKILTVLISTFSEVADTRSVHKSQMYFYILGMKY